MDKQIKITSFIDSKLSEHSEMNVAWWTLSWELTEAPGKKSEGLLVQVYFVTWIVLEHDFMPAVTKFRFNL